MGLLSGVLGVLFALAQHDLKRLLAYHSVENIGIITLGLGIGLLGRSAGSAAVAALAFAGSLLHVANHAMFKGLLFLAAGSVQHATHTLEIDRLGGLSKNMKWTAATFLVGSAAICGLPPLNGFVSEFLIYLASYKSSSAAAVIPGGSRDCWSSRDWPSSAGWRPHVSPRRSESSSSANPGTTRLALRMNADP